MQPVNLRPASFMQPVNLRPASFYATRQFTPKKVFFLPSILITIRKKTGRMHQSMLTHKSCFLTHEKTLSKLFQVAYLNACLPVKKQGVFFHTPHGLIHFGPSKRSLMGGHQFRAKSITYTYALVGYHLQKVKD